jgi:hypothetical protein
MAPLLYKLFFDNLERRMRMTNAAAIGYMIRAAKQAGLDHDTIKELEALMNEQMDFHTEEEAEQTYRSFY